MFEQGEYVLREGDELGSDAKFYLIASGTVTCHKTFEVRGLCDADRHGPAILLLWRGSSLCTQVRCTHLRTISNGLQGATLANQTAHIAEVWVAG